MPTKPEVPIELLDAIYSVLTDRTRWPEALRQFCEFAGTIYTSITTMHFRGGLHALQFVKWGMSDEDAEEYYRNWAKLDPWMGDKDLSAIPPGTVAASHDFCPDEILEESECYQKFLKPRGLHYGAGAFLFRNSRMACHLGTLRPKKTGPLSALEMERIRTVVPHLQRVFAVIDERDSLIAERDVLKGLFDSGGAGAVLLDQLGGILAINSPARRAMERNSALEERAGRLCAAKPAEDQKLQEAIRKALDPWLRDAAGEGVLVTQTGKDGEDGPVPLRLVIVPAHGGAKLSPSVSSTAAIVLILDPDAAARIDVGALRRFFSLSRAEAEVAAKIASGLSIAECAEALHLSQHTIRSHVKKLFLKTGTNQQSALVSMLLRAQPPPMSNE